jgi:hypothetical protein
VSEPLASSQASYVRIAAIATPDRIADPPAQSIDANAQKHQPVGVDAQSGVNATFKHHPSPSPAVPDTPDAVRVNHAPKESFARIISDMSAFGDGEIPRSPPPLVIASREDALPGRRIPAQDPPASTVARPASAAPDNLLIPAEPVVRSAEHNAVPTAAAVAGGAAWSVAHVAAQTTDLDPRVTRQDERPDAAAPIANVAWSARTPVDSAVPPHPPAATKVADLPGLITTRLQQTDEKGQTIEVQLDPPELGRLTIRLVRSDGRLQVDFLVANEAARVAVQGEMPALQRALEQAGFAMTQFNVSQQSDQSGGRRGWDTSSVRSPVRSRNESRAASSAPAAAVPPSAGTIDLRV